MPPEPLPIEPAFELVDETGSVVSENDFDGNLKLLFFGFTSCPDICPLTLQVLANARAQLAADGFDPLPRIVLVSVDPERDSLPRLAEYARFFHPHVRGGTASSASLARIGEDWGVGWEKAPGASAAMGYTVDHTSILFLVGPNGQMRKAVPHGSAPDRLTEEIRGLLGSSGT